MANASMSVFFDLFIAILYFLDLFLLLNPYGSIMFNFVTGFLLFIFIGVVWLIRDKYEVE